MNYYSRLKHFLPTSSINYLRNKRRKYLAKKNKKRKEFLLNKHGSFNSKNLHARLKQIGIKQGDCLFVQCSFNDLHTFSDSPMALLDCLKEVIGETGTLFFPAYTNVSKFKPNKPVNLKVVPTYTGIVNEVFRRSPKIIRSNHPRHSICGQGPLAKNILSDHHTCQYADGKNSPFDKMRKLSNAKILTLGLDDCYLSFLHWIEDIEPSKLPFRIHKKAPKQYELISTDGNLYEVNDFEIDKSIVKLALPLVCNKISTETMRLTTYKGISINMYLMKPLAKELKQLRDQGIIHYKQEH